MTMRGLSASAIRLRLPVLPNRRRAEHGRFVFATMTLKIDKIVGEHTTTLRLVGRLRREHLSIVTKQIQSCAGEVTIDLGDLILISVEGVRFLNTCEDQGVVILNASPYVTAWMKREKMPADDEP